MRTLITTFPQFHSCIFSDPSDGQSLVFATSTGQAPEMKHTNKWLIDTFVGDFCSDEEKKNLTPKAWRKGWANWAEVICTTIYNFIAFLNTVHFI